MHLQTEIDRNIEQLNGIFKETSSPADKHYQYKLDQLMFKLRLLKAFKSHLPREFEFVAMHDEKSTRKQTKEKRHEFVSKARRRFYKYAAQNSGTRKKLKLMGLTTEEIDPMMWRGATGHIKRNGKQCDLSIDHIVDIQLGDKEFTNFRNLMIVPGHINAAKNWLILIQQENFPDEEYRLSFKSINEKTMIPYTRDPVRDIPKGEELQKRILDFLSPNA